ncbi:MAG: sugar phosphate nucleotidyltransferase [Acidobacteriota bacterium]
MNVMEEKALQTATMAVIAAGEGSRLRHEGVGTAKPLVEVGGVPMIERLLQVGMRHGVTQFHVIINEQSADVREFLKRRQTELPIHLIVKTTPSSMHSLFELAPHLSASPFLLATVDSIFRESEFAAYVDAAGRCAADGLLAVTHFIEDEKPLCVVTDTEDRVLQFSDTAECFDTATGGLYWFRPRIFDVMADAIGMNTERLRNFLRLLVARGYDLRTFRFSKMIDVDHASDIAAAEALASEDARDADDRVRMH